MSNITVRIREEYGVELKDLPQDAMMIGELKHRRGRISNIQHPISSEEVNDDEETPDVAEDREKPDGARQE